MSYVLHIVLRFTHILSFNLHNNLMSGYYYYSHFTDKKTEAYKD